MKKRHLLLRRREEPQRAPGEICPRRRGAMIYGVCQKNHAANVGGYAVDGCREFMASGEEGTGEALKCAACGCHRSFHRREEDHEVVCNCSSPTSSMQQQQQG